jgi:hypothetical protein
METTPVYKVIGYNVYKMRLVRETKNFHVFWKHEKETREAKNHHMPVFTRLVDAVTAALDNLHKKRADAQATVEYFAKQQIGIYLK